MPNTNPVILAVDDQPIELQMIFMLLKKHYRVIPVTKPEKALRFLESTSVDLILSDIMMPKMNGYELLQHIRELPNCQDTPVIFLTGDTAEESEYRALIKGASDYISKPIKGPIVSVRVQNQLILRKKRNALESLVKKQKEELTTAYAKAKKRQAVTYNLLARAIDYRDNYTGRHVFRTTEYVRLIVEELMRNPEPDYIVPETKAAEIISSAKLHDIGKIAIPDNILLKNGKLTDEEFSLIETHTNLGGELLKDAVDEMGKDSFFNETYEIALKHHEKWNGTGYPSKMSGTQIPLSARIMALADVYDAVTSERPYKHALSHEAAVKIIQDGANTHFDPYLVKVFTKIEDKIASIGIKDRESTV